MTIDCLTFDNPIDAYLVCAGVKTVENRVWTLVNLPRRVYVHVGKGSNCPYIGEDDMPKGAVARYRAWRDKQGGVESWMPAYDKFVKAERAYYGVEKLADVGAHSKDIKNEEKAWMLKSSAIIGWMDLDKITTGDPGMWCMPGQYHWHIASAGLLEAPILKVSGKRRLWRYDYG